VDRKTGVFVLGLAATIALAAGLGAMLGDEPSTAPAEVPVLELPLAAPLDAPEAELSGLAWWHDQLVLLPQEPAQVGGTLYAISRDALEAAIDRPGGAPLEARPIELVGPPLDPGEFDGYEAIAFDDDDVWIAAELLGDRAVGPVGRLYRGRVEGDLERIVMDAEGVTLAPQTALGNTAYETLVRQGDRLIAIYETNGEVNPAPHALAFGRDLSRVGELTVAPIEYRITDATEVDGAGRFWVANYHWPGAPWSPGTCQITERYGEGESHARCRTVERLLELRLEGAAVEPTDRPPILLELVDDAHPRNWEGIVRLGDRGFLLVTDEHPRTILAFVPMP